MTVKYDDNRIGTVLNNREGKIEKTKNLEI